MKSVFTFLAGVAGAIGIAWLFENNSSFRQTALDAGEHVERSAASASKSVRRAAAKVKDLASIDLNSCSREDLMHLGLSQEMADRVIENRPYRNKLDLISRLVVPEDIYESMKHRVGVDDAAANDPVKVAS